MDSAGSSVAHSSLPTQTNRPTFLTPVRPRTMPLLLSPRRVSPIPGSSRDEAAEAMDVNEDSDQHRITEKKVFLGPGVTISGLHTAYKSRT